MVGLLIVEVFADHLHNLKEKRQILSSLKDRIRQNFNVGIAETDYQESWQKSQVSIVSVSNSKKVLENMFRRIEEYLDTHFEMRITCWDIQYL